MQLKDGKQPLVFTLTEKSSDGFIYQRPFGTGKTQYLRIRSDSISLGYDIYKIIDLLFKGGWAGILFFFKVKQKYAFKF